MTSPPKWGIHWFRRDLRVAGNSALRSNWKHAQGRTLGIFCFDAKFLSRPDFSHNRFAFFLDTLKSLRQELNDLGGDLLVVDQLPADFFASLFSTLQQAKRPLPTWISWGRDYEPFALKRDAHIEDLLHQHQVTPLSARDHLIFEPHEIEKGQKRGEFYQVYSPFSRKWFDLLQSQIGQCRLNEQEIAQRFYDKQTPKEKIFSLRWQDVHNALPPDRLETFYRDNQKHVTIPIPKAGFQQAYGKLREFKSKLNAYREDRDRPDQTGTSRLSIYLKNGSLTTSQILHELDLPAHLNWHQVSGPTQFVKEIAWREFYYHILFHRPDVESRAFNLTYENLAWENNRSFFQRWKEGTTGFPIVDAGMRQLAKTGWMHNRVRMIVASFLTKDLLIDWRWGEQHFMHQLLDGDLAPNNGGWQWAASTGCDPQPYFRIFNPWLQSAKFDPEGTYIRQYIPELKDAPASHLHAPEADRSLWRYPAPMVDHAQQKAKAIKLYKHAR